MKNKKKIIWIIVIILTIIALIAGYFRLKTYFANLQDEMIARRNEAIREQDQNNANIKNEIVFVGKVAPQFSQEVYIKTGMTIKELKVQTDQVVNEDELLLVFNGAENINHLIAIQENKFFAWQEDRDWYNTKINEIKDELSWADQSNTGYIAYLKKELANYQTLLATNNVNWNNAKNEIVRLKDSYDSYNIKADFDGFIYKINDNAINNPTLSYLTLYSTDRIVVVEVSEYELRYIQKGQQAQVTVEGTGKTDTGTINKVEIMPNNLSSNDTSYFNIEISIPDEVPYGYSVVIAVKIS